MLNGLLSKQQEFNFFASDKFPGILKDNGDDISVHSQF